MSPNPDHEMDIKEAMSTTELRDKDGNIVDPAAMEIDPDWLEHMEDSGDD